jgi:Carboxypeptidase regulatory-like domain
MTARRKIAVLFCCYWWSLGDALAAKGGFSRNTGLSGRGCYTSAVNRQINRVALTALLWIVSTAAAYGAPASRIVGVVVDPIGAVIPECSATLYGTEALREAKTDEYGRFEFSNVPQGEFDLEVKHFGFKVRVIENIRPTDGNETLTITLELSSMPGSCEPWSVSLDYELPAKDAKLTGFLVDLDGGISSATITVTNLRTGEKQSVSTEKDGAFHFAKLASGRYSITFSAPEYPQPPTVNLWVTKANQTRALVSYSGRKYEASVDICL